MVERGTYLLHIMGRVLDLASPSGVKAFCTSDKYELRQAPQRGVSPWHRPTKISIAENRRYT